MQSKFLHPQPVSPQQPARRGGLPVRTNLRAGLAWDDLDDQAKALWQQLTSSVANTTNAVKASVTPNQS